VAHDRAALAEALRDRPHAGGLPVAVATEPPAAVGGRFTAGSLSGHVVAICAIMSVFWLRHPRFRLIYAICIATVFIGKLGANYHFVSDLIAGGLDFPWIASIPA
jgi:hypothetical protein